MAEKKKQHFVPQFYLKNWAVDPDRRRISLYAIGSGKHVAAATIKDQAYENYLYGKGNAEDVLSEMEGKVAPIIARAMKDNELPAPLTPDHAALLTFALLQDARTPSKAAGYDEQSLKVAQYLAREFPDLKDRADGMTYRDRETPLTALRIVAEMIPELQDLRMKLLVNRTPMPFVTSDDPCVRYNQFMEKRNPEAGNTGLGNKGLQMFFPLSPKHLLALYDGEIYRVGGSRHLEPHMELTDERDVAALNLLQAVAADETLFYGTGTTAREMDEVMTCALPNRGLDKVILTEHAAIGPDGKVGTLLQTAIADLRIALSLSCVTIVPSAGGTPLNGHPVQLRRPDVMRRFEARMGSPRPCDARGFVDHIMGNG